MTQRHPADDHRGAAIPILSSAPGPQVATSDAGIAATAAPASAPSPDLPVPLVPTAADIARGVARLLAAHGIASVRELTLPDGRRADIVGLGMAGAVVIVEIKSSVADFQADHKWPAYRAYCDRLYFAVGAAFPIGLLPAETGLIVADRYDGMFVREAPTHPLSAPRRKAMTLRFALTAANRLLAHEDRGAQERS